MNPTNAETERTDDTALVAAAAGSCIVASLIVAPVTGMVTGLVVASVALALRRRRPTVREVAKVLAALAVTTAMLVVLADWSDFKEGIAEGFHRIWRP
jgi:uncharacterized membrane protein